MKHLRMEETKLFKALSFGTKWNLRDCLRHKSRSFMTLFGIVGCMVLLVGGLGMKDTMDAFLDIFYEKAINYRYRVNLDTETVTNEEARALAEELEGDWCAQRRTDRRQGGTAWRSIPSPGIRCALWTRT